MTKRISVRAEYILFHYHTLANRTLRNNTIATVSEFVYSQFPTEGISSSTEKIPINNTSRVENACV